MVDPRPSVVITEAMSAELAQVDAGAALAVGATVPDAMPSDLSPGGFHRRAQIRAEASKLLRSLPRRDVTAAVTLAVNAAADEAHEMGDELSASNFISPPRQMLSGFERLPKRTPEERRQTLAYLRGVPDALRQWKQTLERSPKAMMHEQAERLGVQLETFGRAGRAGRFAAGAGAVRPSTSNADDMDAAARSADQSLVDIGNYLKAGYRSTLIMLEFRERYQRLAAAHLGIPSAQYRPDEMYERAWRGLVDLTEQIEQLCTAEFGTPDWRHVVEQLQADNTQVIQGTADFSTWLSAELQKQYDDVGPAEVLNIAPQMRGISVDMAAPGSQGNSYYKSPSADGARSGVVHIATGTQTTFLKPMMAGTLFHEGVMHNKDEVTARLLGATTLQRTLFLYGFGEGAACTGEHYFGEVMGSPADKLGVLLSLRYRAARAVVAGGLALGRQIPAELKFEAGKKWNGDRAQAYLKTMHGVYPFAEEVAANEYARMMDWPGQSESYFQGMHLFRTALDGSMKRHGVSVATAFDHALQRGHLPLGMLPQVLDASLTAKTVLTKEPERLPGTPARQIELL